MKNIIYIFSLVCLLFASGCTKDFEEINTNPNAPNSVQPNLLLRQMTYDFGEEMSYEGFVAGDLLSQHRTAIDFNLFDRHALKSPQLGGNPWPVFYVNLRDNEILLNQSQTVQTYAVYEGPSLILKAYMAAGLTDLFGDVPYSEAFNGVHGIVTPKYDKQEDIYLADGGILDNLDKGIAAINNYSDVIALEGDILFNGNLDAWVKFANSLKNKSSAAYFGKSGRFGTITSHLQFRKLYAGQYRKCNFQFYEYRPESLSFGKTSHWRFQQFCAFRNHGRYLERFER